jgi:hypothetical protein
MTQSLKTNTVLNLTYDSISHKDTCKNIVGNYKVNFEFYELESVDKYPEKSFYYILFNGMSIEALIHKNNGLPLSVQLKNCLKTNNNLNVIIINEHESDNEYVLTHLDGEINRNELNPKQFHFLSNNLKLNEIKQHTQSNINVCRIDWAGFASTREMSEFIYSFVKEKEYLFMMHNRVIKSHRIGLLCYLKRHNILDSIDWSFIKGDELIQRINQQGEEGLNLLTKNTFSDDEILELKNEIDFFKKLGTKKSKFELIEEFITSDGLLDTKPIYKMNSYSNSYINIVGETQFEMDLVVQVTEKSYLPFYFFQIPIIVATKDHIKKMKETYGFDFFDDLIDHSYDSEPNHNKRLKMILNEIIRLNNNKDKVINFYKNNEDRFIKNRELTLNVMNIFSNTNYLRTLS